MTKLKFSCWWDPESREHWQIAAFQIMMQQHFPFRNLTSSCLSWISVCYKRTWMTKYLVWGFKSFWKCPGMVVSEMVNKLCIEGEELAESIASTGRTRRKEEGHRTSSLLLCFPAAGFIVPNLSLPTDHATATNPVSGQQTMETS